VRVSLLDLDASTYAPHALHARDRAWSETNCYVDLVIEVLAAHGLEPHASLPFTFALDFEGDQWLFFKQPVAELDALYGLDVQELTIWRSLEEHVFEQTRRGRMTLVEVDAHYLPDTRGLTYRTGHSKTTIGVASIDRHARVLGYFHNAGYFELTGDDYAGVLGLASTPLLPPYAEFVKFDRVVRRPTEELVQRSVEHLRRHLARRPSVNPIVRFAESLDADVARLATEPPDQFHLYSFATFRQLGACFELAGSYVRWLGTHGEPPLPDVVEACERISSGAKSLQFQLARALARKRPLDAAGSLGEMADAWRRASETLAERYLR